MDSRKKIISTAIIRLTGGGLFLLLVTLALLLRVPTQQPFAGKNLYKIIDFSATNDLADLHLAEFNNREIAPLSGDDEINPAVIAGDGNVFRHRGGSSFTPPPMRVNNRTENNKNTLFADLTDRSDLSPSSIQPDNTGWGWLANDAKSLERPRDNFQHRRFNDASSRSFGFLDDNDDSLLGSRLRDEYKMGNDSYFSRRNRNW